MSEGRDARIAEIEKTFRARYEADHHPLTGRAFEYRGNEDNINVLYLISELRASLEREKVLKEVIEEYWFVRDVREDLLQASLEREKNSVYYNHTDKPIFIITAFEADLKGGPGKAPTQYNVPPGSGIDLSILGLLKKRGPVSEGGG